MQHRFDTRGRHHRGRARIVRRTPADTVRHDLCAQLVAVAWIRGARIVRGRVTEISSGGDLLVALPHPPVRGTEVTVEISFGGRRAESLAGEVLWATSEEALIRLSLDPRRRELMRHFIEEATGSRPFAEIVRIRSAGRVEPANDVEVAWVSARSDLDDDGAQQRFIQACLAVQNVRLAVDRYRSLKLERPNDDRVGQYLEQVGTILGFCALARTAAAPHPSAVPSKVKVALLMFVAAVPGLWAVTWVLAS